MRGRQGFVVLVTEIVVCAGRLADAFRSGSAPRMRAQLVALSLHSG